MNYQLSEFYKRDTSFVFDLKQNPINWLELRNGKAYNFDKPLIYNVDKIDSYLDDYDILPSIGITLISKKFASLINHLINKEIQFFDVIIFDNNKNSNINFVALNLLKVIPILDKEKSVFDVDEDNYYDIHKFYIKSNSLEDYSIVRMEEHKSYIIVSEEFKKRCEEANLKGVEFIEEGHSIYTDI